MVGSEANAVATHGSASILIQRLHFFGDVAAEQNAEIFHQLEGQPLGKALQILGALEIVQRLQDRADMVVHEALDTSGDVIARIARQLLVGEQDDARTHDMIGRRQTRDGIAEPAHGAVGRKRQVAVAAGMQARGARLEFQRQGLLRCRLHGARIRAFGPGDGREPKAGQLPHMMSFDEDIAIHTDFSFQHRILSQALHEHRCPAINKAFRQPLM